MLLLLLLLITETVGRPITAITNENIAKVHQMVLDDRRIKVRKIAEVMNRSKERVCHILNQHLGMRKLPARWMPRFAHGRPKTGSNEHFQRSVGAV